jgi:membrane protein
MMNIEDSFNKIWGLRRTRSWYRMLSDYLMILLVLPFAVAGMLSMTAVLESPSLAARLGPFASGLRGVQYFSTWLAFTVLYFVVPNTRVKFRYALLAGVVAGTLWTFLSLAYVKFQFGLPSYSFLYSTFAQVPVLLMWVYCSWLVLLFGAELTFAYQNERTFAMERFTEMASYAYREALGLWTMIELGRRFDAGLPGLSAEAAAREWNVPSRLLNDTLGQLEDARLAIRSASNPPTFQPSRSLDKVTVYNVVACLRESGREPSQLREHNSFKEMLAEIDQSRSLGMQSTIAECIRRIDAGGVFSVKENA